MRIVLALWLAGCAPVFTAEQRRAAAGIPIGNGDPPAVCEDLGSVRGGAYIADDREIRELMRLEAEKKGANHVRMSVRRPGYAVGEGYHCPPEILKAKF